MTHWGIFNCLLLCFSSFLHVSKQCFRRQNTGLNIERACKSRAGLFVLRNCVHGRLYSCAYPTRCLFTRWCLRRRPPDRWQKLRGDKAENKIDLISVVGFGECSKSRVRKQLSTRYTQTSELAASRGLCMVLLSGGQCFYKCLDPKLLLPLWFRRTAQSA